MPTQINTTSNSKWASTWIRSFNDMIKKYNDFRDQWREMAMAQRQEILMEQQKKQA